ncbi:MAG: FAD-dependent hydroxylase [Roseofilum sp. Belize BBD 4]|uniref:FAD-dependent hydroxylase n=1 Tax=Roseofilum sp. Belize BBD 4 TaxID=2821500 RepID=UPI000E99B043|nr:FAD-dependent hydroxylase [Roseofilum sp. Belize BBD 4]MBP0035288.1 FAD-dependent hydroxylase [Roseofilum sp. Belize BBD 4]HBQ98894.1 2-octaprenyl-6-methoxyphenyl hydroxylase [Cyanobacteria bacterium UBA11691]
MTIAAPLTAQPTIHPHPTYKTDIAIVGAGIVGATLACALKDSGLNITLIETQPQEKAASKRQAYALTLMSGKIFERLGVWQEILPQIVTFNQIQISDANRWVVNLTPNDLGMDRLGYVGEHRVILTALQRQINQSNQIQWVCPGQVQEIRYFDNFAQVWVNSAEHSEPVVIESRLVVATDGAKSPIRQAAEISTQGWRYWQSCVATTIKTEKPHNNVAFERFWYTGPMGVLPLPGNRVQVVWTAPHEQAEALQQLDEAEFLRLLEYRTDGILGRLELDGPRFVFPVKLMQCDRYVGHRLALAGDAAHCCHPVGGQGLNLGIRDAAALAEIIKNSHTQNKDIGNLENLKPYQQWRKPQNWMILGFTDFLDRTFSTDWFPVVWTRRLGLLFLQKFRIGRTLSLRLMTGLMGRAPEID